MNLYQGWDRTRINDLYEQYFGFRPHVDAAIPAPDPADMQNGQYFKRWVDPWGCVIEEAVFGLHGIIKVHPVDQWSKLADLRIPAGPSPDMRLFERMQWLRGYENLMMDFADGLWDELDALAAMIMEHNGRREAWAFYGFVRRIGVY